MEAIILVGPQGAGKSTWVQRNCADTHVRLNLDMLKTRHRESVLLHACLAVGQPFVVDNTNPTRAARARYLALARAAGYAVRAVVFDIALEDALRRNEQREAGRRIPEIGVRGTFAKLEPLTDDEGFDSIEVVKVGTP